MVHAGPILVLYQPTTTSLQPLLGICVPALDSIHINKGPVDTMPSSGCPRRRQISSLIICKCTTLTGRYLFFLYISQLFSETRYALSANLLSLCFFLLVYLLERRNTLQGPVDRRSNKSNHPIHHSSSRIHDFSAGKRITVDQFRTSTITNISFILNDHVMHYYARFHNICKCFFIPKAY